MALDEFQYFHRKALDEFTSHLQFEVDRLTEQSSTVTGGLLVLGSIHTEMAALLEDRSAPLFNRITDELDVTHLDIASVLEILRAHGSSDPGRLLAVPHRCAMRRTTGSCANCVGATTSS